MEESTFSKYLSERYHDQINWYDSKAADNQKRYSWMQWSIIVLAAITPVLIQIEFADWFHYAPTVTSAVVAILTAGLKTFKYQENWINYRTTCENLRKEKYYFDADLGEYGSAHDKNGLFIDRVERLISQENTMWISAQKRDEKSDSTIGVGKS